MHTSKWWLFLQVLPDGWSSSDPAVDKLLKHLSRKGRRESSRSLYLHRLHSFCIWMGGLKPFELIKMDKSLLKAKVQEFCDRFQESRNYANTNLYALKKFFDVIDIELNLQSYPASKRWRQRPEYIPPLEEALKMTEVTRNLRDRCIILFLIYCGLRNATLRALRISENYPNHPIFNEYTIKKELKRDLECMVIIVHNVMKKIIPDACKNDIPYFGFVPRKAVEALKDYLRERKRKRGHIADEEPLFILERVPISARDPSRLILSGGRINQMLKEAARRAGLKYCRFVTANSMRKVFNNFLINQAENRKLKVEENEFLMGHLLPGSRDTYFDKTKIEAMRRKYSRLDFERKPEKEGNKVKRIISEEELPTFLELGCTIEIVLPSGKIVVVCDPSKLSTDDTSNRNKKNNNKCESDVCDKKIEGEHSGEETTAQAKEKKKPKKLGQNTLMDFQ